jgi:hypothetical protein
MTQPSPLDLYNHLINTLVPLLRVQTLVARYAHADRLPAHPNSLVRCGRKIFSQNDEDGITLEILRRIGLSRGVFVEFGVGNGLENNTLALAAAGWSGCWVGGEDLAFNPNPRGSVRPQFHFRKEWVTRANIVSLHRSGLASIGRSRADLVSLDLDGNDLYFAETLLAAEVYPELFIVEYNGKFPPPIRFTIDYDDQHRWKYDDYFGASLTLFHELFQRHGYFLSCCNVTGVNAFFVKEAHREHFKDLPESIEQLYEPPKYFLSSFDYPGHPVSRATAELIVARINDSGAAQTLLSPYPR